QALGLRATTPDDDARAGGVEVDAHTVTGALDLDLRDASPLHALGHERADRDVFLHVVAVALTLLGGISEPPAAVLRRDPETEPIRIDLLAHSGLLTCSRERRPR